MKPRFGLAETDGSTLSYSLALVRPMIDDAVLEQLITSAATQAEVPVEGPARVLEARGAAGPPRTRARRSTQSVLGSRRRRWLAAVSAAAVFVVVVSLLGAIHGISSGKPTAGTGPVTGPASSSSGGPAAGGGSSSTSGGGMAGGSGRSAQSGAGVSAGGTTGSVGAAAVPANGAAPAPVSEAVPNEVPILPSKVVKTGSLTLTVASGQVAEAVAALSTQASGQGGFVASSTETSGQSASADVTLRVPVANFGTLVADAQRLGTTVSLSTSGQDVTSQFVDLQARIQALQDTRSQFEQILAKAESIGDILSVESQISGLQTQIEQLQGQLEVLDDQASYSTLAVHIGVAGPRPAPVAKPASGVSKAWQRARHSFSNGVEAIVAASGGFAVFLLAVIVLAVVGRLAWLYLRRRLI